MWRVNDGLASLEAHGLSARVSLPDPSHGLFDIRQGDASLDRARLLQLPQFDDAAQLAEPDYYVRGPDLVVTYRRDDTPGLHCHVEWKQICDPDLSIVGLELLVSVHTDLLQDDAVLQIESELACVASFYLANAPSGDYVPIDWTGEQVVSAHGEQGGTGLFLHRLANGTGSYAEIIHSTDFTTARLARNAQDSTCVKSTAPLLAEELEKGVIRRARVQALFLPTANDQATAYACYRRFTNSPLPLTT